MRELFGRSYVVVKVIRALSDGRKHSVTELITLSHASSSTVLRIIDVLRRKGFLVEEREKSFPFTRYVKLTERGKLLAELLIKADDLWRSGDVFTR
ncbi:MAG: MarR family transcriptional regulator [Thermoprotei archaeon]|nr:MAG: MarR family transcriptional regulator [Thermoprotei archaeon]